jgi:hypothetical protein
LFLPRKFLGQEIFCCVYIYPNSAAQSCERWEKPGSLKATDMCVPVDGPAFYFKATGILWHSAVWMYVFFFDGPQGSESLSRTCYGWTLLQISLTQALQSQSQRVAPLGYVHVLGPEKTEPFLWHNLEFTIRNALLPSCRKSTGHITSQKKKMLTLWCCQETRWDGAAGKLSWTLCSNARALLHLLLRCNYEARHLFLPQDRQVRGAPWRLHRKVHVYMCIILQLVG